LRRRSSSIAAPVNTALSRLARDAARDGRGPGIYPPDALASLLGLSASCD